MRRLSLRIANTAPGLFVAILLASVATAAGHFLPIVGGPVFGIIAGFLAAKLRQPGSRLQPGLAFASRPVLQLSIVVLGATLSLGQVVRVGVDSLPVMVTTLTAAFLAAWAFGRLLRVRGDAQLLIGVGTAICGASAIAATQAVIRAKDSDVAYAIGTIFTFNVVAVLTFPALGHLLDLSPHAFGLWAGTAINDTSSVTAAAYAYVSDAGSYALVVKLTRTLMLIPIVLVLAALVARKARTSSGTQALPWARLVPLFLIGFIGAAALNSFGLVPEVAYTGLTAVGTFLITTALVAIGMSIRMSEFRKAGLRPLALGACVWLTVIVCSLTTQALTTGLS